MGSRLYNSGNENYNKMSKQWWKCYFSKNRDKDIEFLTSLTSKNSTKSDRMRLLTYD